MTEPLTDPPATVCPCCLQRIIEIDPGPPSQRQGESKAGSLQKRVEEIARKCLKHDPALDQWQDRRDLK
jgi:hypothetical protein